MKRIRICENKQSVLVPLFVSSFDFDRREVYRILQEEGIDLPRYAVLNRDPDKPDGQSPADNKSLHICTENICDDAKSTCFS